MMGPFLLSFREILEMALLSAIVVIFLRRTGRHALLRLAYYGVFVAAFASLSAGILVWILFESIEGPPRALFEASAAFVGVVVISYMIFWMAGRSKMLKEELEGRIDVIAKKSARFGLFLYCFIIVFREGVELVLFLIPFLTQDLSGTAIGVLVGAVSSLAVAYATFVLGMKISMRKLFFYSSLLLMLMAGGILGQGVHELLEYLGEVGVRVGWLAEPAYVLKIPPNSLFHEDGVIGSVFSVMLGYSSGAEWARLILHMAYLAVVLPFIVIVYRRDKN
jgi:high-affinity iron transporter